MMALIISQSLIDSKQMTWPNVCIDVGYFEITSLNLAFKNFNLFSYSFLALNSKS